MTSLGEKGCVLQLLRDYLPTPESNHVSSGSVNINFRTSRNADMCVRSDADDNACHEVKSTVGITNPSTATHRANSTRCRNGPSVIANANGKDANETPPQLVI